MRTKLLLSLFAVSIGLSAVSLMVIRGTLERQIRQNLFSDLRHSVHTFKDLQSQRQASLNREAALLADLPSLKALMTTSDAATIEDGGARFWHVSGMDIFALADRGGKITAVYGAAGNLSRTRTDPPLHRMFGQPRETHLISIGGRLFEMAYQPLYFGPAAGDDVLGYVAIGYEIDDRVAREVSDTSSADVIFAANGEVVSSTLDGEHRAAAARAGLLRQQSQESEDILLGKERYLAAFLPLQQGEQGDVRLVVLKSYDAASQFVDRLNRTLAIVGLCVLVAAGLLAIYLAKTITRPLERLAAAVAALGSGDFDFEHKEEGAKEIRELDRAFRTMRSRLRQTRQELLEAEQLATIGRMSSSISHDLRHSLSAVYANAEFLESLTLDTGERSELLAEIRLAVQGMTELIDSLLLFSRTGQSLQLGRESPVSLIENAISEVRKHPTARLVRIDFAKDRQLPSGELMVDGRKIRRALCNLLLNASQAALQSVHSPQVVVTLTGAANDIVITVEDNGPGVPASIRARLFEPFVSAGKQNGIGLGLALALRIAQEHDGTVIFRESNPGATVFQMVLPMQGKSAPSLASEESGTGRKPG